MRFRGFLALRTASRLAAVLACPAALVLAASCAPVDFAVYGADFGTSSTSGAGGGSFASSGSNGSGAGAAGGGLTMTAGTGGEPTNNPTPSYASLCGGAAPACVPGPQDQCAQGGNPGMGGSPADASMVSCKVVTSGNGVAAQCVMAGSGADGDPCMKAADCGPELGCIAGLAPTCRSYCCASLESCPANTYCVKAQMNEAQQIDIPVCIPVTSCVLLDNTGCTGGQVCAIVRQDGTTSCVTPGTGTFGEPCPCAAGYTCNMADGTCLKLCHIGGDDCGMNGYCQGGTKPYPKNIGYCVYY